MQLQFYQQFNAGPFNTKLVSDGTLSFVPMNLPGSISFNTINFWISNSSANMTHSLSIGIYSLNLSTLSMLNSLSFTISYSNSGRRYLSGTAAQNLTPGTWWLGILVRTGGNANFWFNGASTTIGPANAFPGAFTGGIMSASTAALPASYATSDLDITGNDAINQPHIIISA